MACWPTPTRPTTPTRLSQSHPGCAVVPAALAAGEEHGIDGTRFLRAVTLGYDVGTRVTMAMGGVEFRNQSHRSTHSIAGVFGAAAAAASAAGLDAQQMRWVLDYTAQQSSGIAAWQRDTDHIEKAFVFGGMSARNGVTAAQLVKIGWTGVDDVFSGADNFFQAYAPAGDPAMLVEQLGERYEITRTDIKKWTVGSPIQGPLDAIEILRKRRPFDAGDVASVVVRLAPTVADVVDNRDIPDICLQHMVAVMLIDKTASFKAAHDKPRMQDAAVLRERAKIQLVRDEPLQKLMPVRVAIVEIVLADGTRLTERVDAVRGTPRNPDGASGGDRQGPGPDGAGAWRFDDRPPDRGGLLARHHGERSRAPSAAAAAVRGLKPTTRASRIRTSRTCRNESEPHPNPSAVLSPQPRALRLRGYRLAVRVTGVLPADRTFLSSHP